MNDPVETKSPPVCQECGNPDAFLVAGQWLCESCYSVCGSCCHEFAGDDLSPSDDDDGTSDQHGSE